MKPSILLLDCSLQIEKTLIKKGYDVESGTLGYINTKRKLPTQIYEKNLFFYNPSREDDGEYLIGEEQIDNQTPEFHIAEILGALNKGSIVVAFLNKITPDFRYLNLAYAWIPGMPKLLQTKDSKILKGDFFNYFSPIYDLDKVVKPVSISINRPGYGGSILINLNDVPIGYTYKFGEGHVFLIPTTTSNDEVILSFINRMLPKLWKIDSSIPLIDKFKSPDEKTIEEEIKILNKKRDQIEQDIEAKTIALTNAKLDKSNVVNTDETAILILKYIEIALSQKDIALFYIYKVCEAIEKKFGSEKTAKEETKCNAEFNLIGKLANASYADIRHAPNPGEKIKEISEEDLLKCFDGAEKIITSYLKYLFENKK